MADAKRLILRRWRMHRDTWDDHVSLEATKPAWSHVMLSDGEHRYFLNLPVVFDSQLQVGVIILELDRDAIKKAERSATSQA